MSGISYGSPTHRGGGAKFQSNALGNIKSIVEHFEGENVNILSEGVQDVLTNKVAFAEYVDRLVEGTDDTSREQLMQLAENTRLSMLQESMVSGSNPISALSLPMLRVGWPKLAVREGLPTEPVEQPKFKVTTKRPYIRTPDGEKHYLPKALTSGDVEFGLPQLQSTAIPAVAGTIASYDLLAPISKNHVLGDEIDARFSVVEVSVSFDAGTTTVVKVVNFELDTNNNVVSGVVTEGTDSATILVKVNREKGIMDAAAIGAQLMSLKVLGFVSSEANNAATQIAFDIDAVECVIGTAQPVESPINIQHMTDVMHMYQVDATLSHIETMTTFLAHTTDKEGVRFIEQVYQLSSEKINETFDVVPPANYALGDAAWREQVKIKLDRLVTRLQVSANIYAGHAVVFCHPLDAQVISNVKWIYAATEQVNDVAIDYKVGQYVSGTTSYIVLQSPHFTQGSCPVVYVPSDAEHKTLVYYPYSFNTVRGAASSSANSVNLPAIQMIKRHLFKAFTPLVAKLNIANNAG